MKNAIANWEDIDWGRVSREVFRRQGRIFDAAKSKDRQTLHAEQMKLLRSFYARLLAVRQVAFLSKGRKTAGPDGMASLTGKEALALAKALTLEHEPNPVKRVHIPKPGKDELRPLGIPNIADRAHQALLTLALDPEWEARYSDHMYGFRKGRCPDDAAKSIRCFLGKKPRYVLDADVEKFFDHVNHDELLKRMDSPPAIEVAVARILKAGTTSEGVFSPSNRGTPQGGPLSPTLANIAMAGLEGSLMTAFSRKFRGKAGKMGKPRVVIWADDLVVIHEVQEVIQWSRNYITEYLDKWGLRLSEKKTSIRHTQLPHGAARPGFDFLGFHFQHVWSSRRKHGGAQEPYALITPSKESIRQFLEDFKELLKGCCLSRKHRSKHHHLRAGGKQDAVSRMIVRLNRKIRGWANYFRSVNSKKAFSALDHEIHNALWHWAERRFPNNSVGWRKEKVFSGRVHDRHGIYARRQSGNRRKTEWVFKSPFVSNEGEHEALFKMANTAILRRVAVVASKSFFDRDWRYWGARNIHYPGTPPGILRTAFKRQKGKCLVCGIKFLPGDRLFQGKTDSRKGISHIICHAISGSSEIPMNVGLDVSPV